MKLSDVILAMVHKEPNITGYSIMLKLQSKATICHQQIYKEIHKLVEKGKLKAIDVKQEHKPNTVELVTINYKEPEVVVKPVDITKLPIRYALLTQDILNGSSTYDKYVKLMQKGQDKVIASIKDK